MNLFDQLLAVDPASVPARTPRAKRTTETTRTAQKAVVALEPHTWYDADYGQYECLCGKVLINWDCQVCDVRWKKAA